MGSVTNPISWVVQKYGGTSVGKFPDQITDIIRDELHRSRVAVVCSARSTNVKSEGTTNQLLRAAAEAGNGNIKVCREIVQSLLTGHLKAIETYLAHSDLLPNLNAQIESVFADLIDVLTAACTLKEVSSRTLDNVIGKGEILSCHIIVALLQHRGVQAQFVDLSDVKIVDAPDVANHGFYAAHVAALKPVLAACYDRVPVVTGYFGPVPGGLLNQVGRGYTDLCAALVSISLSASELQIWKEVDGIYSADPRKVPTARLLPTITPAEAAELTFFGSEVLHPFTMEQIVSRRIPIRIKNTTKPYDSGTVILPDPLQISVNDESLKPSSLRPSLFRRRSRAVSQVGYAKRPTAVTAKHKILVINVHSNKRSFTHGYFAGIFSILDKWRMSVDLISSTETNISLAFHCQRELVRGKDEEKHIIDADLKGAVTELMELGDVNLVDEMAVVSLVGKDLKNMIGICGKMTKVFGENNINIEMIAQGASEINISCVVEERDADRAMNVLHTHLFTFFDDIQ